VSRWFRFYNEALDDPKVQQLDPAIFKYWVNLLCLACRNNGKLPSHEAMAFALRMDIIALESLLDRLLIAGLIDVRKGGANGSYIAPHGWEKRQYKSDTSTERVKRFRNVSKPLHETAPDTDTETELPLAKANGASDKIFWENATTFVGKRSVIGKWIKDHGKPETAAAITAAQLERAVDPIPYITAVLRKSAPAKSGFSDDYWTV
jgi:hypothetical protein